MPTWRFNRAKPCLDRALLRAAQNVPQEAENGPGASSVQEFLVRDYFLEDDGDANDEEEDGMPEPNTYWIEKDDLLETID